MHRSLAKQDTSTANVCFVIPIQAVAQPYIPLSNLYELLKKRPNLQPDRDLTTPSFINVGSVLEFDNAKKEEINPLNPELNPMCYLLALLRAHHFLHVSRISVKLLTLRLLTSYIYIYGAPILDVSRSHTTTLHSR